MKKGIQTFKLMENNEMNERKNGNYNLDFFLKE